jgi:hypothetical protein
VGISNPEGCDARNHRYNEEDEIGSRPGQHLLVGGCYGLRN